MLYSATIRQLEIIGEATKNLSVEFREKYPEVPWKRMASLRDIVAHKYHAVNMERIFDIAKSDVPKLLGQIKSILK